MVQFLRNNQLGLQHLRDMPYHQARWRLLSAECSDRCRVFITTGTNEDFSSIRVSEESTDSISIHLFKRVITNHSPFSSWHAIEHFHYSSTRSDLSVIKQSEFLRHTSYKTAEQADQLQADHGENLEGTCGSQTLVLSFH